ncbi:hypothetical protein E8E14_000041, partial [Neopestalotiopsis sp. 37M]
MDQVGPTLACSSTEDSILPLQRCQPQTRDSLLSLPAGFPSLLKHALAWTGNDWKNEQDFVYQLSENDLLELRSSLAAFKALELDGDFINSKNFSLPTLGPKLEDIRQTIYDGRGFSVIRGINPANFSIEDLTMIWLGIQTHVADQRGCQDHKGNMIVHIMADDSSKHKIGHHRHSTSAITFHTEEAGDIASWLTRSTAASGGCCIIASAYHVYNVLAAQRPEIIRTLAKSNWPFAFPHFQCRPILFHENSRIIMNFGRVPLLGNATHPRSEHLPQIRDSQKEALDLVEAIARATQLEIKTQPGDMHFVNNLAILHRREQFTNGP